LLRYDRSLNLRPAVARAVRPGARVLDAGCGAGVLSLWAAQAGAPEVVAVDHDELDLARGLARENGVADAIEFVEADLVHLDLPGRAFDVVLAMIYLNDPRRDEAQSEIAYALRDRYLAPGGRMLPERVRYFACGADWPAQDHATRRSRRAARVRELEQRYGLALQHLADAVEATPWAVDFPARGKDGRLLLEHARLLSDPTLFVEIDYTGDRTRYPAALEIAAKMPGVLDTVVWTQELWFEDLLLFCNESVSWIENPRRIEAGEVCRVELGPDWRRRNCARIV
jgi:SAM-dependent methyltransferase